MATHNLAEATGEPRELEPWHPRYLPAVIIAVYAAFALFATWAIRLDYGPDEPHHLQYAYEIAVDGRLPDPSDPTGNLVRTHPPIYYLIVAGIWRATGARQAPTDTEAAVEPHQPISPRAALARRLMRGFSVLLGCLTLVVVARILVVIGVAPAWRPFLLAAFGLWPLFQWISSVVSNDNIAILFSAIACLAVVSRLRAGSTTLKQAALLGLLIGLGAWAKRPTLFVVPIAAWVVFATSPNDRRAAGLACFGLAFLAIAAWWHVYLYFTAGSPFPKFHAEEWDQRSAWELITNDPAIIAWMPVELACHAWVPDWAGAIIPMAVGRLVFAALAVLFVAGIVKAWRSRGEAFLGPLRWTSLVGIGVLVAGIMHYSITVDIRATICGRYLLSGAPWLVCLVAACLPRVKTSGAWHHVRRYLPVVLGAWVLFDVAWWILVQTMYETLGRMVS